MSDRILVVEDEEAIADAVRYALTSEDYDVAVAADGEQALAEALSAPYDLLLLDVMLPGLSGIEICRRLRAADERMPILMLTAKDAEVDRVLGLEVGADDYVTKPFSMPELLARVRALLRRRAFDAASPGVKLAVGGLAIDLVKHEAAVDGTAIPLTTFELKLLALLAAEPERVFTRREIMRHLWDSDYVGDERACDLHVSNIRRKIEADPANPDRLVTVRGAGYKLQPV